MLQTFTPTSAVLQQFVDTIYTFSAQPGDRTRYLAFPHTNVGLSFFKGVDITRGDFHVNIQGSTQPVNEYTIEILGKYTRPVLVDYSGKVDEIAIIFKPVGINRFLQTDFIKVAPGFSQPFTQPLWMNLAPQLFDTDHVQDMLEEFLLSILSEKESYAIIDKAVAMLADADRDYSVPEVAEQLGLHQKTFQRLFTKTMACSPSDYKRIARFRNVLKSKLKASEKKSLTSITYENNYTDQSYLIKEFQKLTHQNPRHFFKEVSMVDGDKIVWEIL